MFRVDLVIEGLGAFAVNDELTLASARDELSLASVREELSLASARYRSRFCKGIGADCPSKECLPGAILSATLSQQKIEHEK
jgi:hypothetical protein